MTLYKNKYRVESTRLAGWDYSSPGYYFVTICTKYKECLYASKIILFTLLFYSLLFPLRWYSSKSFKKAQKNAPRLKELQEKMKAMQKKGVPMDDPEMRKLR